MPENVVGELLAGELIVSPRPAPRHARTQSVLGGRLGQLFDWRDEGPGPWWIFDEPEVHLGEDVLVPDIAGWRRERLPGATDAPFFSIAPDWACEILSPSTTRVDRTLKLPTYAREQVGHVWLIDPGARSLEVYRREEGRWHLCSTTSGDARVRAEPFEELELALATLWLSPIQGGR